MKSILRPYQESAISVIKLGFARKKSQICVLPTGSGKTLIFSRLIEELGKKTLIIAHTHEIIEQTAKTLIRECPTLKTSIYSQQEKMDSKAVVCTFQAACRPKNLQRLKDCGFEFLIIDECHRSCALAYKKIIEDLDFNKKMILGVTATPFRTDGKSIYEIFGFPTFTISLIEMIEKGYLCDFLGYRVRTLSSLEKVRRSNKDFVASDLEAVINVKNRNQLIVREYLKISPQEKAVAFCAGVKHAMDLKKEFIGKGVSCEVVHGNMADEKRKHILKEFQRGTIRVLTNCSVLTEGFDEPSITTILMCRPTSSKGLYVQMIGRGSRLSPGKDNCKIIEFTDNSCDVCQMEDLIEVKSSPVKMLQGESLISLRERSKKSLLEEAHETRVEIHDLLSNRSKSKSIFASQWQLNALKERGIRFVEPLLGVTAEYLLRNKGNYGNN